MREVGIVKIGPYSKVPGSWICVTLFSLRVSGLQTYSTVQYNDMDTVLYCTVYCMDVLYSTVLYCMDRWIVVSYSYVLYSTIPGSRPGACMSTVHTYMYSSTTVDIQYKVCRSAVRQTKTGITKKQNEKITVAMALGAARLSLRIATTAST